MNESLHVSALSNEEKRAAFRRGVARAEGDAVSAVVALGDAIRAEERAAVVAWLRGFWEQPSVEFPGDPRVSRCPYEADMALKDVAESIERGEHVK